MFPNFRLDPVVRVASRQQWFARATDLPLPPCAVLAPHCTIQKIAPFHLFNRVNIIIGVLVVLARLCRSCVGCCVSAALRVRFRLENCRRTFDATLRSPLLLWSEKSCIWQDSFKVAFDC